MMLMILPDSRSRLRANIAHSESYRQYPYKDTTGHLTIGFGRNLEAVGISQNEALILLDDDIQRVEHELWNNYPNYASLNDVRKSVLIEMAFELGIEGLMGFKIMMGCIAVADWQGAGNAILDSLYAHQVGDRAKRVSEMMVTGVWNAQ